MKKSWPNAQKPNLTVVSYNYLMNKFVLGLGFFLCYVRFLAAPISAQTNELQYQAGTAVVIDQEHQLPLVSGEAPGYLQIATIRLNDNSTGQVQVGDEYLPVAADQRLAPGDQVIVARSGTDWILVDHLRLANLVWLFAGFILLVVVVAHLQGLASLVGLSISLAILVGYTLPQLLAGQSPVLISLISATGIAGLTVYVSHGFNIKSHLGLLAILSTLTMVSLLAYASIDIAHLAGLGSEEASFLQVGQTATLSLKGLLLAGIILGTLGILDDSVIAQISVVQQLKLSNPSLTLSQLYTRALQVGKDHVASLVNTLVLAYAGANLPLFILFYINTDVPLWVTLNNELVAEEVVRTLAGSIGLVAAVPIATLLAAYVFSQKHVKLAPSTKHHHH